MASEREPLALFAWRPTRMAALYMAGGLAVGAAIVLVGVYVAGQDWGDRGLSASAKLVGWRINLMAGLPWWVAIFLSNLLALVYAIYLGPLGCALEMHARDRWPRYRRMAVRSPLMDRLTGLLSRRLRPLTGTPAHDGVVIAYVVPLLFMVANGAVLGAVMTIFGLRGTTALLRTVAEIAPHGVLEIPALCLAGGLGILAADRVADAAEAGEDIGRAAMAHVRQPALARSALILVAVLLAAGFVEGEITPRVSEWLSPVAGGG
ncbi:MAG TPA: stage II sporulation protein M [Armatimonadota bacterium]|nr:stage II sporulation protein M [Armatimonadota bacterium]